MLKKLSWAAATLLLLFGGFALEVHANPSFFLTPNTSPVSYLASTGQATTTALDSYVTTIQGFNSNALFIQFNASSTSSVLNTRFQYSYDGVTWYDDNTLFASSSNFLIQAPLSYQWTAIAATTTNKVIPVPVLARYVRAVFTMSGAAGSVVYTWGPTKQNP